MDFFVKILIFLMIIVNCHSDESSTSKEIDAEFVEMEKCMRDTADQNKTINGVLTLIKDKKLGRGGTGLVWKGIFFLNLFSLFLNHFLICD